LLVSNGIVFEMMRYKAHLTSAAASGHVVISYDRWFADSAYREALLAKLGLPCLDNSLGAVQVYGGGSSFEKAGVPAAELAVSERWKTMKNDTYALGFLRLAARDQDFMVALKHNYPADTEIIDTLLAQT
jgi:hypothetical protein